MLFLFSPASKVFFSSTAPHVPRTPFTHLLDFQVYPIHLFKNPCPEFSFSS